MTPLAGDARTQSVSLVKIAYFSGFIHAQVSKIYNTVLVVFGYINKKILHIVPLRRILGI